jgi:hypothetical protein
MAESGTAAGRGTPSTAPPASGPVGEDVPVRPVRSSRSTPQPRRPPAPPRVLERHYRQTLRKIDLWSVLKISICFYLSALLVAIGATTVLWWFARVTGALQGFENFMADSLGEPDFRFVSWRILQAVTLIGLVLVCIMVVLTVVAAALYNVYSELIGGVEVTVAEEETGRR